MRHHEAVMLWVASQHVASSLLNWSEMTAIATSVLALGLFVTAGGVAISYRAAKNELRGTQAQIDASRRPLLIDVTPTAPAPADLDVPGAVDLSFPGGHETSVDVRRIYVAFAEGLAFFAVPLRNVGPGLAAIDTAAITASGEGLASQPLGREVQRERVPSGEMTRVLCTYEHATGNTEPDRSIYELRIPYADLDETQRLVAVVHLEHVAESKWRIQNVQQSGPSGATAQQSNGAARREPRPVEHPT
jgi:hypothetical protein